jgi:hypothetical protein
MRHLSRLYEGRDRVAETVGAHQWAFNNKCIDSIQEHVTENLWLWHQAAQRCGPFEGYMATSGSDAAVALPLP